MSNTCTVHNSVAVTMSGTRVVCRGTGRVSCSGKVTLSLHTVNSTCLNTGVERRTVSFCVRTFGILGALRNTSRLGVRVSPGLVLALLGVERASGTLMCLGRLRILFSGCPAASALFCISVYHTCCCMMAGRPSGTLVCVARTAGTGSRRSCPCVHFILSCLCTDCCGRGGRCSQTLRGCNGLVGRVGPTCSPGRRVRLGLRRTRLLSGLKRASRTYLVCRATGILRSSLSGLDCMHRVGRLQAVCRVSRVRVRGRRRHGRAVL